VIRIDATDFLGTERGPAPVATASSGLTAVLVLWPHLIGDRRLSETPTIPFVRANETAWLGMPGRALVAGEPRRLFT
jgi:hypothetical protein